MTNVFKVILLLFLFFAFLVAAALLFLFFAMLDRIVLGQNGKVRYKVCGDGVESV